MQKPGTYHVVATYRSGDTNNGNKLAWSEANNKITAGNITTPHTKVNNVLSVGTVEFDIVVTEAGEGTLILQPVDNSGAPQLDKLEITPKMLHLSLTISQQQQVKVERSQQKVLQMARYLLQKVKVLHSRSHRMTDIV